MTNNLTPNSRNLTRGVRFRTHRQSGESYASYGFNGFSEEGYVWACPRVHAIPLWRERVRCVKRVRFPVPSCGWDVTPPALNRKVRCKIGGWLA